MFSWPSRTIELDPGWEPGPVGPIVRERPETDAAELAGEREEPADWLCDGQGEVPIGACLVDSAGGAAAASDPELEDWLCTAQGELDVLSP